MADECIKVAALGRKFELGQLYDFGTDKIVENAQVWSDEVLKEATVTSSESSVQYDVIGGNGLSSKCAAFEMSNNLKLSFYSGFVKDVSGAAVYLNCKESPKEGLKYTLKCTKNLSSKRINVDAIPKENYQEAKEGSHVVVKIQYGWQALFVLQSYGDYPEYKRRQILEDIKIIPAIKMTKKGKVRLSKPHFEGTKHLMCQYFGDVNAPYEPKTYVETIKIHNKIISDKTEFPITIWLKPLHSSGPKVCLTQDVSNNLVEKVEHFLQEIQLFLHNWQDLMLEGSVTKLPFLRNIIQEGFQLANDHSTDFRGNLARLLVRVRENDAHEDDIKQLIPTEYSPFAPQNLKVWLDEKKYLIHTFNQVAKALPSIPFFETRDDFDSFLCEQDGKQEIICFLITTGSTDTVLEDMKYLSRNLTSTRLKQEEEPNQGMLEDTSENCQNKLIERFQVFSEFAHANQSRATTSFVVAVDPQGVRKTIGSVQVFQEGQLKLPDVMLPSKPKVPKVNNIEFDQITLKLDAGKLSSSEKYEVQCKPLHGDFGQPLQMILYNNGCCTLTQLRSNTGYTARVRIKTKVGCSPWSEEIRRPVFTLAASKPGKPTMTQTSIVSAVVQWVPPTFTADNVHIEGYRIDCLRVGNGRVAQKKEVRAPNLSAEVSELLPNVTYKFSVTALCSSKSVSETSDQSDNFILSASNPLDILKAQLITESQLVEKNQPSIYQLSLKERIVKKSSMMRKCELGRPKLGVKDKVIMVVGATGAGKTTLINGMINYIVGVKWEDRFRFKFIDEGETANNQAKSQTRWITAYTLHHQDEFEIPYSLSIIDTPGFGDTSGIKRDKEITDQIRDFFSTRGPDGIDHIDAIGFVAQSSLPRLTPTQKFIFDSILSLFGKDIADNIFLLVTFADGQKPPVLAGIREAQLPFQKYFKFNNSALFASNENRISVASTEVSSDSDDSDGEEGSALFDRMFWEMGEKSFQTFFKSMNKTQEKSLVLTKDVLEERNKLETNVVGIQQQIQAGLNKLEQLRVEAHILKQHQSDIDKNKDFTYTVVEDTVKQVNIPPGTYTTNCLTCNFTCHYPCFIPDDNNKVNCAAMYKGQCGICPQNCVWNVHKNMPFRLQIISEEKVKTSAELKERYEEALGKQMTAEKLIEKVVEEFQALQLQVTFLTNEIRKSLDRLKNIALKPNPLTTVEYIDILIDSEERQKHPGWRERLRQLHEVKMQAQTMADLCHDGFDPFEEYKIKFHEEQRKGLNFRSILSSAATHMSQWLDFCFFS